MGMKDTLDRLHRSRFYLVGDYVAPGERLLDTGSARAEKVPNWREPVGNEDFGGFIVVTNRQVIYRDFFGTLAMPWSDISHLKQYRMGIFMTTGVEITFLSGATWLFSGNSPFIKALLRMNK